MPESMECEIRVNGERHEAASAAMAPLNLPVPKAFTAVRYYALLIPLPPGRTEPVFPNVRLDLDEPAAGEVAGHGPGHQHDDACAGACQCGGCLDGEHPGFALPAPYLIEQLSDDERTRLVRVSTDVMVIAEGVGNFLLAEVLRKRWPAAQVLGDRDPRLRVG
ncbi:DUF6348 family protein [Actinospica robiniae]|uniref:DUF6348 family protein n=1 Tax=Actinospica robiniae TaxID=304901 RepID=UPI0012F83C63|nr:DUF6348 family protein [Actinospica robiniae]